MYTQLEVMTIPYIATEHTYSTTDTIEVTKIQKEENIRTH
jgi:hypothetical protein